MNEPVLIWSIQVQSFISQWKAFSWQGFLSVSGIYERMETLNFSHDFLSLNTEKKKKSFAFRVLFSRKIPFPVSTANPVRGTQMEETLQKYSEGKRVKWVSVGGSEPIQDSGRFPIPPEIPQSITTLLLSQEKSAHPLWHQGSHRLRFSLYKLCYR